MTDADLLRGSFVSLEVDEGFTEVVLLLGDDSRLRFRHRVDQRQAEALVPGVEPARDATFAGRVVSRIAMFRLNRRHLDVQFEDGSRWEALFGDPGARPEQGPA
jgi:hypothetical protein